MTTLVQPGQRQAPNSFFDSQAVGIEVVRMEQRWKVIARKLRRFDSFLEWHVKDHAIENKLDLPLVLLVAARCVCRKLDSAILMVKATKDRS
jgi:hypothetical protein